MLFVGRGGDGVGGALLRAARAADAVVRHFVADQRLALPGRADAGDVRLVLLAEVAQRGQHGIRGGLAEAAEAAAETTAAPAAGAAS